VQSQGIDTNAKIRVQKFLGQADGTLKPEAKKAQVRAKKASRPQAPTKPQHGWSFVGAKNHSPSCPQKMEHTPP
jgi:hypothetical protein